MVGAAALEIETQFAGEYVASVTPIVEGTPQTGVFGQLRGNDLPELMFVCQGVVVAIGVQGIKAVELCDGGVNAEAHNPVAGLWAANVIPNSGEKRHVIEFRVRRPVRNPA